MALDAIILLFEGSQSSTRYNNMLVAVSILSTVIQPFLKIFETYYVKITLSEHTFQELLNIYLSPVNLVLILHGQGFYERG
jgi:hypothetical protein